MELNCEKPVYTLPQSRPSSGFSSVVRNGAAAPRTEPWHLSHPYRRESCQADRFIPRRRNQNADVSNYLLTKVPPPPENPHQIDILDQISKLDNAWRKRAMKRVLEESGLCPSMKQQSVLNIRQTLSSNRENHRGIERTNDNNSNGGTWKVKPRDKPLLNHLSKLSNNDLRFQTMRDCRRAGLLDWGSTNFIASAIGTEIIIYDQKLNIAPPVEEYVNRTKIQTIKWNHAGNVIAIGTNASGIKMYQFEAKKVKWERKCRCSVETASGCKISCLAWTQSDAEIVTGCTDGRITVYSSLFGEVIDTLYAHSDVIVAIAFSPNDRYLVSTGMDKAVHIHTWPLMAPHLAIGYYEPVQALAWHPWEVDMLCIGGGFEDGSLSLWDIHHQTSLGFRKVNFLSVVKNMTWNKLSGELLVQWNYQQDNSVRTVVPVFSSLDRIVDVVTVETHLRDIVWKPDGTRFALRLRNGIVIRDFFGNETSKWFVEKKNTTTIERKQNPSTKFTGSFMNYCIR